MGLFLLLIGIIGLWLSTELIVYSSLKIASRLKISHTFIGLTVLSIGTTLPELATHIIASIDFLKGFDASAIALGANVGSNILQITLVLGLVALLAKKIKTTHQFLNQDYLVMLGSIILLFAFSLNGWISRTEGLVLAGLYLVYIWKLGKQEHFVAKMEDSSQEKVWWHYLFVVIGLTVLFFAANLTIDQANILSKDWKVENSLIGVLLVGIGAALPELVAALVGIRKKAVGISLGLLVGSNITNPLFGAGIGALISGYTTNNHLIWFDLPFWFFVSLLIWLLFRRKMTIGKKEALGLIFVYLIYVILRLKIGLN